MNQGKERDGFDMADGYIKLWRKVLDTGMIRSHNLWIFWTWCLLKASWKQGKVWVGKQEIELQPGQFVFGLNAASEEIGLSIQNIRTSLIALENYKNLTRKVTSKFSIITICNWESYQSSENITNNQTNEPLTIKQQSNGNNKEVKKERSKEDKRLYGEHVLLSEFEKPKEQTPLIELPSNPPPEKKENKKPLSETFLRFYSLYPKKIGRGAAEKAWKKLSPDKELVEIIVNAIPFQIRWHKEAKEKGQFYPEWKNPASWLNQGCWADENYLQPDAPTIPEDDSEFTRIY